MRRQLLVRKVRVHTVMCGGAILQKVFTKDHQPTSLCARCPKTPGSIMMPNPAFCLVSPSTFGRIYKTCLSNICNIKTSKRPKEECTVSWGGREGRIFKNSWFCFHGFDPHRLQRRRQRSICSCLCPTFRSAKQ